MSVQTANPKAVLSRTTLTAPASNHGLKDAKVMMRTKAVLLACFLLLAFFPAAGQSPVGSSYAGSGNANDDRNAPETIQSQPLSLDQFNGSGKTDPLVPGVIKLSILDAMDRALRHNLGLLLSQQQVGAARARHWRNLSALLPNVTVTGSETLQQINL